MHRAYIGIGSNIGDRETNVMRAVSLMKDKGIVILKVSSLYETAPWGVANQPDYINAAVEAETALEPMELLKTLREIEKRMGRFFESTRWGPRIIDLDILFYDNLTLSEPSIRIPHPLIAERSFVLDPLAEIAPTLVHPVTGKTVKEMLEELKAS